MKMPAVSRTRKLASLFLKQRRCPLCGWFGFRFEPFGNAMTRRDDARCVICGSLERHRLAFVLMKDRLSRGQRILHVAPEDVLVRWLVSVAVEYLSIDLQNPAMRQMDLTRLDLADRSRTLVWCSHVLEHIADDDAALSEMFRVLTPGGVAMIQVPIGGAETLQDQLVVSRSQRLAHYLQEDHVRLYGRRDLKKRIEAHGFVCEVLSADDLPREQQVLHGLVTPLYREVFLCRKPA